jgi:type IV pilus assembly protein PilV
MKLRNRSAGVGAGAQQGVMLIEALVAILIFTLGVVALMGLQANSIAQMSAAKYRTDASYLVSQIMGKIWVDQSNAMRYASPGYIGRQGWDALVASTLPHGAGTITVVNVPSPPPGQPGYLVTVAITWKMPEDTVTHSFGTTEAINPS